jgi:RNA-directed DNA polymerase
MWSINIGRPLAMKTGYSQPGKVITPFGYLTIASTPIVRHVKVKGESSPYDGNLVYWSKRRGESPELPPRVATLIKRQKGNVPTANYTSGGRCDGS